MRPGDDAKKHDTLLSDVDTSIKFFYTFYVVSNTFLLASSAVVILVPILTAANLIDQKWGFLSAACGALLGYLGLSGVSANFIKARNDLQIAKYQYFADKDLKKLIAAYAKAKTLASYVPTVPSMTDQGQHHSTKDSAKHSAGQSP